MLLLNAVTESPLTAGMRPRDLLVRFADEALLGATIFTPCTPISATGGLVRRIQVRGTQLLNLLKDLRREAFVYIMIAV